MKRPTPKDLKALIQAATMLTENQALYFNAWCNLLRPTTNEGRKRARKRVIDFLSGRAPLDNTVPSYNQAVRLQAENHLYGALYIAFSATDAEATDELIESATAAAQEAIGMVQAGNVVAPKMELEGQQLEAANAIWKWLKDPGARQSYNLFGFAGTGKSYLIREVSQWQRTVCCAYTGMAALNLSAQDLTASTINSLIYRSIRNDDTGEISNSLKDASEIGADLIVVDECFMVPKDMGQDLEQLGIKLLRVGDSFQLPPVDSKAGYWVPPDTVPESMLTETRRQAKDNPIVYLSTRIRKGKELKFGKYGESAIITMEEAQARRDELLTEHQGMSTVICGMNKTRRAYNNRMREIMGYALDSEGNWEDMPVAKETLMCLKNEKTRGMVNGQLWTLMEAGVPESIICKYPVVDRTSPTGVSYRPSVWRHGEPGPEGEPVRVTAIPLKIQNPINGDIVNTHVPVEYFSGDPERLHWRQKSSVSEFDFGYVLTAHKAQGSTFDNAFVIDESWAFRENQAQWLYVATTRPRFKLTLARRSK